MEIRYLLQDKIDLFDKEIVFKAEEILFQMKCSKRQFRGHKRKLVMFYCLYQSFKENNYVMLPEDLAKLLDINKTDITKAFKICSYNNSNYTKSTIFYNVSDFITYYLSKYEILQEYINDDIYEIIPRIQGKPQKIALLLIVYYLKYKGHSNNTILHILSDDINKIPQKPKWIRSCFEVIT